MGVTGSFIFYLEKHLDKLPGKHKLLIVPLLKEAILGLAWV